MYKYNYHEAMYTDIRDYIVNMDLSDYEDARDLCDHLNDELWTADSVTGNGSGSYTFSRETAREYVIDNLDLLKEACSEFGCLDTLGEKFVDDDWEYMDVTIRCYLLGEILETVILDMEIAGELNFEEVE